MCTFTYLSVLASYEYWQILQTWNGPCTYRYFSHHITKTNENAVIYTNCIVKYHFLFPNCYRKREKCFETFISCRHSMHGLRELVTFFRTITSYQTPDNLSLDEDLLSEKTSGATIAYLLICCKVGLIIFLLRPDVYILFTFSGLGINRRNVNTCWQRLMPRFD